MRFPAWTEVDDPKERARHRLRYLINTATSKVSPRGTLTDFANFCGVDRTSLHTHMRNGAFSPVMAVAIERAVGPDVLRATDLTNPLDIVAE